MNIYFVKDAPPGHRWQPTQATAKDAARTFAGTSEMCEVGKDGRQGMCDLLNRSELEVSNLTEFVTTEPAPAAVKQDVSRDWTATEIEDFILARASVAQVEGIFSALGARFKELSGGRP